MNSLTVADIRPVIAAVLPWNFSKYLMTVYHCRNINTEAKLLATINLLHEYFDRTVILNLTSTHKTRFISPLAVNNGSYLCGYLAL